MAKPMDAARAPVSDTDRAGPVAEQFLRAQALHQSGQLDEAKGLYQLVLDSDPDNGPALHFLGILLHQQGKSDDGLPLIEKAIRLQPGDSGQHNNAGKVYADIGRLDLAEQHLRSAVELEPGQADGHANLGLILTRLDADGEAMTCFEAALDLNPRQHLANIEIGRLLSDRSEYIAAEKHFKTYLAQVPHDALITGNLARVVQCLGRLEEAEGLFIKAMDLGVGSGELQRLLKDVPSQQGRYDAACQQLGRLLRAVPAMWPIGTGYASNLAKRGQMDPAMAMFHDIAAMVPDDASLCHEIATTMIGFNRLEDAAVFFNRAIKIDPGFAIALNGLGNVYISLEQPDLAVPALMKAVECKPGMVEPYMNLCRAYRQIGDLDQAKIYADQAVGLDNFSPKHSPTFRQIYSVLCDFESFERLGDVWDESENTTAGDLSAMFLGLLGSADDNESVERINHLVRKWAKHTESQAAAAPLAAVRNRDPDGRLRIGILSSDLYSHSVSKFLMPLMRGYDRERYAFFCYTAFQAPDDPIQAQFMELADKFTFISDRTEREIAGIVQGDGIDILMDLNGFTKGSRITAMTYKPAPVQMSWMGFPFTCGLEAIDYVVMDRFVKPADEDTLVEEPVILPGAWLCYDTTQEEKIAPNLPMDRNGVVTFGSLSNPYKFTPKMIALWSEVLKRVPGSRFLVVRPEAKSRNFRQNLTAEFNRNGVDAGCLLFTDNLAGDTPHISYYNEVDIILDTFPLTGGTTTFDACWMGVPAVTMVGEAFHQRVGHSILMQCGLDELCTFSPADYVEKAVSLAGERDKLMAWRHDLRGAMRASPLCDQERFVHEFQDMLKQVADLHGLGKAVAAL